MATVEKGLVSKSSLTAIAAAIRAKDGKTATMKPAEMAARIQDITTRPLFAIKQADGDIVLISEVVYSKTAPTERGVAWVQ